MSVLFWAVPLRRDGLTGCRVSSALPPLFIIIIIDRFYIALFSALEQAHCARMWFYMSEQLFIARFWLSTEVVYLQRWRSWCHMKLLPSRRVMCTPYNHAPCHFMQSHMRKVHTYLAVTCHLHFTCCCVTWMLSVTSFFLCRAQELCETSRSCRPGLPSLISIRFLWT